LARTLAAHRGVPYFATCLDLLDKRVVVVGGGNVATTKVRALLPCRPAPLIVVAPTATAFIRRAAELGQLEWRQRAYAADDLALATLAFGATDDRSLNARVAADARSLNVPVLAVDDVPNCDFIAPALVRRGDVTVAISTGGRSPAMARRTREHLERALPAYWGDLLDVAATAREKLGSTRRLIEPDQWQTALDGEVERLAERGQLAEATDELIARLERTLFESREGGDSRDVDQPGRVSLVGAGPGDPDLLTLRAVQRLQAADVVVFDRLVSAEVLAYARPDAERLDVGKAPGGRGWTQSQINAVLEQRAREGKQVVRLKGGDPFVFGRGGEEALALAGVGVPFEVVPGISAALAAPAAAGIPVTHRGLSGSVTIVSGHDPDQQPAWSALAGCGGTLVILMAVERLANTATALIAHGRPADEPSAIVQWATTPRQRVVCAPLAEIAASASAAAIRAPAVLIVGPTAALGATLGPASPRAASNPSDADADLVSIACERSNAGPAPLSWSGSKRSRA
jgi:uroporphyrin-III C-methyltransferase/precorrin-2 dehydrogenase/sirohydrochlorin ferrochelatase